MTIPNPQIPDTAGRRAPRRSREELETLAHDFAAAPEAQSSIRGLALTLGIGAVVLGGAVAWLLWPERAQQHVLADAPPNVAPEWQRRMQAKRELQRRAQKSADDYLARSAASDAALLADFSKGAERLAKIAAAAPVAKAAAPKPAPAQSQTVASAPPAKSEPVAGSPGKPQSQAAQEPAARQAPVASTPTEVAKAEPASAPATAPQAVAQAAPGECKIYVAELSSSGKLTYADITRMKGARVDERTQHVFTPPVQVSGRSIVFDVAPNGCVEVARSSFSH